MRPTLLSNDVNRDTDLLQFLMDNYDGLWTRTSMPSDSGGGLSPGWYGAAPMTMVLPDNWTDSEVDAFSRLHRNTPIILELTDGEYERVIARIKDRQLVLDPSRSSMNPYIASISLP